MTGYHPLILGITLGGVPPQISMRNFSPKTPRTVGIYDCYAKGPEVCFVGCFQQSVGLKVESEDERLLNFNTNNTLGGGFKHFLFSPRNFWK